MVLEDGYVKQRLAVYSPIMWVDQCNGADYER